MVDSNVRKWDQVFQDAIHGAMQLPPLCVKIINTTQFWRLRNIKQLSLVNYVYPSASHNRFEHCLGTCYLAGKMVRHLKQQNPDLEISDRDILYILCVEIAALCHDLGHAPFSHVFQEIINEYRNKNGGEEWEHEDASCQMLEHLLEENPGKSEKSQRPKFLYQIVNNKSYNIDVDKWDYLARDSHFLGFGKSFDHERMMKMSKVIGDKICYRDKCLDNFYDMFYARYRQHKTACKHKTALLFNTLLDKVFNSANEELQIFEKVDDMKEFTYLTDNILEEISKNEDNVSLREARNKLKDIIYRSYKYKGTNEDENDQDGEERIFCKANFDFGAGEGNPLENIPFYRKGETESFTYSQEQLDERLLLPSKFRMEISHCFEKSWKSNE
ncbi:deoxynucleoside triphosphate triphosphohydrolase SAMHD1 [Octopus bimaculoides]|nr:deoxynucleoside triphosphate triphosphohydrolase SAMHD1 [Octopus bimaculoides]